MDFEGEADFNYLYSESLFFQFLKEIKKKDPFIYFKKIWSGLDDPKSDEKDPHSSHGIARLNANNTQHQR